MATNTVKKIKQIKGHECQGHGVSICYWVVREGSSKMMTV